METTETPINGEAIQGTVSDELDRLEVLAGRIGLNSSEQAFALLRGLDHVMARVEALDEASSSRRTIEAQLDTIGAQLHKEAARFIRDLGGLAALHQVREQAHPAESHWWWFLDQYVVERRRASIKHAMIVAGIVIVVLIILGTLYKQFLAPTPEESAVYASLQSAQTSLGQGELEQALKDVETGLQVSPNDYELLITKGVILEALGRPDEAQKNFDTAKANVTDPEQFYYTRGQAYWMANLPEKALADAEAELKVNPQSGQAHLLAGQVYEGQLKYSQAMDEYNAAFAAAERNDQTELAALARTRLAMLLQVMNTNITPPVSPTPSPTR